MSEDLNKLRELAEAATPGPWFEIETESSVSYDPIIDEDEDSDGDRTYLTGWADIGSAEGDAPVVIVPGFRNDLSMTETDVEANAAFIAAFNPATALSLLSRIQAAEERAEGLIKTLTTIRDLKAFGADADALEDLVADIRQYARAALKTGA